MARSENGSGSGGANGSGSADVASGKTRRRSPRVASASAASSSTIDTPATRTPRTRENSSKPSKARKRGASDTPSAAADAAGPEGAGEPAAAEQSNGKVRGQETGGSSTGAGGPVVREESKAAAEQEGQKEGGDGRSGMEDNGDDGGGGGDGDAGAGAGAAAGPAVAPGVDERRSNSRREAFAEAVSRRAKTVDFDWFTVDQQATKAKLPFVRSRRSHYTCSRSSIMKIARNRGAHFARPDRGNASSSSAPRGRRGWGRGHAGSGTASSGADGSSDGPQEHWPGPFSEARRLMRERDAAAARREEVRTKGEAKGDEDDSDDEDNEGKPPPPVKVEWQPRGRGSRVGKSRGVPTLFKLCLDLLADNFDCVESLGDVSAGVRNHLAGILCRQLKLTTETLQRLSEPGVTELILPDCSRIEPQQMRASLLQCRDTLRVLRLGTCGRCFGDVTISEISGAGGFPRLEIAALDGTYQLTNDGVLKLIECCPKLTGLELPANPRIQRVSIEAMADSKRPSGRSFIALSLADCVNLGPFELEPLGDMASLQRLSLSGIDKLTDEALRKALEVCGSKLRRLDVTDCPLITDDTLRSVGKLCGLLESLRVGMCPLLTSDAIRGLFEFNGGAADDGDGEGGDHRRGGSTSKDGDGRTERAGNGHVTDGFTGGRGPGYKGKGKAKAMESSPVDDDGIGDGEEDTPETEDMTGSSSGYMTQPASDDERLDAGGANGDAPGRDRVPTEVVEQAAGAATDGAGVGGAGDPAARGESGTRGVEVAHAVLQSRLTVLSLKGLVAVEDDAVEAMAAACSSSLCDLDLNGVAFVTDRSMVALARYCSRSLESLDLSFCRRVTNDGLGHLVDACPRLRSLRLWGCTQIGDRFLRGHSREELVISRY